jgi:hypothetical protein
MDDVHSSYIDTGAPELPYDREPTPTGGHAIEEELYDELDCRRLGRVGFDAAQPLGAFSAFQRQPMAGLMG